MGDRQEVGEAATGNDSDSLATGHDADRDATLRRLTLLANLLDARFGIPGTRLRFGFDSLIGLVPGVGDAAMALFSGYIILEAARLGVPTTTLLRMVWNATLDLAIGAIPIAGDVFDFYWKANVKNVALLKRALQKQEQP